MGGEEDAGVDIGVSSYLLLIQNVHTVSTLVTPMSTLSTCINVYRSIVDTGVDIRVFLTSGHEC